MVGNCRAKIINKWLVTNGERDNCNLLKERVTNFGERVR